MSDTRFNARRRARNEESLSAIFDGRALCISLAGDRSVEAGASERLQAIGAGATAGKVDRVLLDLREAAYPKGAAGIEARVRRVALTFPRIRFAILADNPDHPVAQLISRCLKEAGHESRRVSDIAQAGEYLFPGEKFHAID